MALTAERNATTVRRTPPRSVRPRPVPEILLVTVLFLAYKIGRLLNIGDVARALTDARSMWHIERWLRLPSEVDIQHGLLSAGWLVRSANLYYAWVHFPVTIGFLLWIYLRRPAHYVPLRRLMTAVTALALVTQIAFPLAPPRMLRGIGLIDTAARFGPSVYGPPQTDTLSNQYAAMPSLHVGWAVIVAIGMIMALSTRWRWLWVLYPMTTYAVVVGTANHYWLDGIVAIAIVAVFLPLLRPRRTFRPAVQIPRQRPAPAVPAPVERVWSTTR